MTKRLRPLVEYTGQLPPRNKGDDGYYLAAAESYTFHPGRIARIRSGLSLLIPEGRVGIVAPLRELFLREIYLLDTPGFLYCGTGEVGVVLYNAGRAIWKVSPGDLIARLFFMRSEGVELQQRLPLPDPCDMTATNGLH